jgi:hypothetical protein
MEQSDEEGGQVEEEGDEDDMLGDGGAGQQQQQAQTQRRKGWNWVKARLSVLESVLLAAVAVAAVATADAGGAAPAAVAAVAAAGAVAAAAAGATDWAALCMPRTPEQAHELAQQLRSRDPKLFAASDPVTPRINKGLGNLRKDKGVSGWDSVVWGMLGVWVRGGGEGSGGIVGGIEQGWQLSPP